MEKIVIIGAGVFGREVFWLIQEINQVRPTWDVLGFLDDNLQTLDALGGYPPVLGTLDHYRHLDQPYVACAVSVPKVRKQIVERMDAMEARWATLLHPTACVGTNSKIGEGCIFCLRSGVTVDVQVGNHVHINCVAGAGHDVRIGNFCTLSGHVDLCGFVVLEEGVFLGSHASVLPNAHVGAWAFVGAGSVVLRNVPPGKTVLGVPAKGIEFCH